MISISNQSREPSHIHGLRTSSEGIVKNRRVRWRNPSEQVFHHRTLVQRTAAFDGNLLLAEEIAWPKAQGNEVW